MGQDLLHSSLTAKAFAGLDPALPISVAFRKDLEMNDRLAVVAKRNLAERGLIVSENAAVELAIESNILTPEKSPPKFQLKGEGGSRSAGGRTFGAEGRITGSPRKKPSLQTKYTVTMTLVRHGVAQIWWGSADATFDKPNREPAFTFLIDALTREIGRTVENRRLRTE